MTVGANAVSIDLSAVAPGAIDLLHQCGAMLQPHSGRTLFAHLAGTYSLLQAWGNPMHVCLGGLFHSIYGTNAFRHRSLPEDQRFALQSLIGIQAERLAWDFCHISRPREILSALSSRVDN